MNDAGGLVCAYALDGQGGGRAVGWDEIATWSTEQGSLWVHLDRGRDDTRRWLRDNAGLNRLECDALLAEETRPRCTASRHGLLVILRGVNQHPDATPEDMISLRVWIESGRIITLRQRRIIAVQDTRQALEEQRGPKGAGDLLIDIAGRLIERMGPVLESMEDEADDIEDAGLDARDVAPFRRRLAVLRRRTITLRRYLSPQREVLSHLYSDGGAWFDDHGRAQLREIGDRLTRHVEDLDMLRDRAAITHDELTGRQSEQLSRTMYILSLVATIFLPMTLFTGLLGVNVAGIPGAEHPNAFLVVCAILLGVAGIQGLIFRWLRWV